MALRSAKKVVVVAIIANLAIAICKYVAAVFYRELGDVRRSIPFHSGHG